MTSEMTQMQCSLRGNFRLTLPQPVNKLLLEFYCVKKLKCFSHALVDKCQSVVVVVARFLFCAVSLCTHLEIRDTCHSCALCMTEVRSKKIIHIQVLCTLLSDSRETNADLVCLMAATHLFHIYCLCCVVVVLLKENLVDHVCLCLCLCFYLCLCLSC